MPVVFRCSCGKRWKAPDEARHHPFACPTCGKALVPPAEGAKENSTTAAMPSRRRVGAIALAGAALLGGLGILLMWSPWQGNAPESTAVASLEAVEPSVTPAADAVPAPPLAPVEEPPAKAPAPSPEKPASPTPVVPAPVEPAPAKEVEPPPSVAPKATPPEPSPQPAPPALESLVAPPEAKPAEPPPKAKPPAPEFPPVPLGPPRVEMTKPVRAKIQQGLRAGGAVVRGKAVRELKAYPSLDALDLLLRPALQDPDAEVRQEAHKVLASFGGDKELCLELLQRVQEELKKNPKAVEQPGVSGVVRTLAGFFYPETILPLVDWFEHASQDLAYAAADGVLTGVRDQGAVKRIESLPLFAQLAETKYFAGHFGFRRTLVESTIQMQAKEALPLLIEWLPRLSGRLRDLTVAHLESATGQKHGEDVALWRTWWKENSGTFKLNPQVLAAVEAGPGNVSYYGVQARTNRVIFIFDTSASMLQGTSVLIKLVDAKTALIATLEKLPADVNFNIVTFNSTVSVWKPTPVTANEANKKAAIEHVKGLQAMGRTNSSEALMTAFRMDRNVETIFFVSDGAPSTGPITEPGAILEAIRKINRVQRATIHSVGVFGGVPEPGIFEVFMKRLAEENEGRYVREE